MGDGKARRPPCLPVDAWANKLTKQLETLSERATEQTRDAYLMFDVGDEIPSPPLTHLKRAGW